MISSLGTAVPGDTATSVTVGSPPSRFATASAASRSRRSPPSSVSHTAIRIGKGGRPADISLTRKAASGIARSRRPMVTTSGRFPPAGGTRMVAACGS